jgi:hypothetical protein
MFSPGDLVAAQWCLYRVLIAENTWRYRDSDGGVLFVFLGAYKWDESLLLSWEGRICRLATVHLVGVLMLCCRFVSGDLVRLCVEGMHYTRDHIFIFVSPRVDGCTGTVIDQTGVIDWFYLDQLRKL